MVTLESGSAKTDAIDVTAIRHPRFRSRIFLLLLQRAGHFPLLHSHHGNNSLLPLPALKVRESSQARSLPFADRCSRFITFSALQRQWKKERDIDARLYDIIPRNRTQVCLEVCTKLKKELFELEVSMLVGLRSEGPTAIRRQDA